MKTEKFRNHFSYVIEQLGGLIVFAIIFAMQIIPDVLEDTEGEVYNGSVSDITENSEIIMAIVISVIVVLALIGFVVGFCVRRWYKTWIIVDNDTITVERNTLRSVKNTIGIQNISNVNLNQNIFEMIIGTCNLKLDTNSLSTANSTDIKLILKKQHGEELRKFINRRVEEINTGKTIETEETVIENVKYDIEVTSKDIITNGFYSLSIWTILVFLGSFIGFISGIALDMNDGKSIIASIGGGIAMLVLIVGSLYSMAKSFLKMYDFKVRRGKNKLYIKYGLYNKVDFAIPIDKINAIVIHQTFLARIFRKYSAEIVNVGLNDDDESSAYFTFYCGKNQLNEYIKRLLPEFCEGISDDIKKQPRKAITMKAINLIINILIVITVSSSIIYYMHPEQLFKIIIAIVSAVIVLCLIISNILGYITCGIYVGNQLIGLKDGSMGTTYSLIKYDNIQYMTINQNIIAKKLGIFKGSLHILASLAHGDYFIPYTYGDEIEKIYNRIINK